MRGGKGGKGELGPGGETKKNKPNLNCETLVKRYSTRNFGGNPHTKPPCSAEVEIFPLERSDGFIAGNIFENISLKCKPTPAPGSVLRAHCGFIGDFSMGQGLRSGIGVGVPGLLSWWAAKRIGVSPRAVAHRKGRTVRGNHHIGMGY